MLNTKERLDLLQNLGMGERLGFVSYLVTKIKNKKNFFDFNHSCIYGENKFLKAY
jgi:hypothetical protein